MLSKIALLFFGVAATVTAQIGGGGGGGAAQRISTITGIPSIGCAVAGDVGKIRIRRDVAGTTSPIYACSNTGVGTYAWVNSGTSSGGSGTLTNFSGSGPSWLTWTVTNPTTTPAVSLAPTTGQASHQVIGTCGSGTTFVPCNLLAADLPSIPISTGVGGLGSGISTFLATPSSANLLATMTDKTGTGLLVFATSPTLITPVLGVATATSINKVAFTAPATGATLTIPDGVTMIGPPASGTVATLGLTNTLTGRQDATGAASTAPMKTGTSLPGTCTVGDLYFKSDAAAGQNIYQCQSTNTWTQQLNSGGGVTGLSVDGDGTVKASVALTIPAPSTPTYNAGGTTTCNLATSNYCAPTTIATSGTTLALTNPHGAGPYWITFTQPASSPVANPITFPGTMANCPQPSPTASKITTFQFVWTGTAYRCLGSDDALDTPITVLSGDVTTPGSGSGTSTLATVNSNVGSCGDATHVCQTTFDGKGRATAATPVAITGGGVTTINGAGSTTQSATETQIATISMPAMGTNNACHISADFTKSGTASTWGLGARLTNTSGVVFASTPPSIANTSIAVNLEMDIKNTGSASQLISGYWTTSTTSGGSFALYAIDGGGTGRSILPQTANLASPWTLVLTALSGSAMTDTIKSETYNVRCQ